MYVVQPAGWPKELRLGHGTYIHIYIHVYIYVQRVWLSMLSAGGFGFGELRAHVFDNTGTVACTNMVCCFTAGCFT
jgi:hypothetical protein